MRRAELLHLAELVLLASLVELLPSCLAEPVVIVLCTVGLRLALVSRPGRAAALDRGRAGVPGRPGLAGSGHAEPEVAGPRLVLGWPPSRAAALDRGRAAAPGGSAAVELLALVECLQAFDPVLPTVRRTAWVPWQWLRRPLD